MAKRGPPYRAYGLFHVLERRYSDFCRSRMAAIPYWTIMLIIAIALILIMWIVLGRISDVFE